MPLPGLKKKVCSFPNSSPLKIGSLFTLQLLWLVGKKNKTKQKKPITHTHTKTSTKNTKALHKKIQNQQKVFEANLICLSRNEFFVKRKCCLLSRIVLSLGGFRLYLHKKSIFCRKPLSLPILPGKYLAFEIQTTCMLQELWVHGLVFEG